MDKDFRINYKYEKKNMERAQIPNYWEPEPHLVQRQLIGQNDVCQQQEPDEIVDVENYDKVKSMAFKVSNIANEDEPKVYDGLFGEIRLLDNGIVQYVDCKGKIYHETFDRQGIRKTFPMGISLGGLSMSIWFKTVPERNICFNDMTGADMTDYETTISDNISEPKLSENDVQNGEQKCIKFDGIQGNVVTVYATGHVVYTDVDGEKHNVDYKRSKIQKCYPNGICFGGLPRTLWLNGDRERDQCFIIMKNCFEKNSGEVDGKVEEEAERAFTGLYGRVFLKPDYEVEFSSLNGDRVECSYNPRKIRKVFPMGIASPTFPTNIWFEEMEDCERCYQAMKETC